MQSGGSKALRAPPRKATCVDFDPCALLYASPLSFTTRCRHAIPEAAGLGSHSIRGTAPPAPAWPVFARRHSSLVPSEILGGHPARSEWRTCRSSNASRPQPVRGVRSSASGWHGRCGAGRSDFGTARVAPLDVATHERQDPRELHATMGRASDPASTDRDRTRRQHGGLDYIVHIS